MAENEKRIIEKRVITAAEQLQLKDAKRGFNAVKDSAFNWTGVLLGVLVLLIIGFFGYRFFRLLFPLAVIGGGYLIRNRLQAYYDRKEEAIKVLAAIEQIEATREIEIITYQCERAVMFKDEVDTDVVYFMDVGQEELLVFWDYEGEYAEVLPNSASEIYQGKEVERIFGVVINPTEERFEPTIIPQNILWDMEWDFDLFEDTIIIPMSFDDLMLKIERHLEEEGK